MKHYLFENEKVEDGKDPGATGTGDRPEWLPDQFKTPEDLAKSYEESRKEMNRLREQSDKERAQFATAVEQMEQMQQQSQVQQQSGLDPQTQADLAAYQQAVEAGDGAAQLAISLALNTRLLGQELDSRFDKLKPTLDTQSQADRNIAFELAQERVGKLYGDDWKTLQPEVQAWLNEHQSWLPVENDPAKFEQVIREGALTIVNAKKADQLAQFEADRNAKLGAQTATGAGQGRYPTATDDKKQAWEEVKGADVGSYDQAVRGGRS